MSRFAWPLMLLGLAVRFSDMDNSALSWIAGCVFGAGFLAQWLPAKSRAA